MANHRIDRINEEMMKELSNIMRDVKDYRLSSCVVTVTGVSCAPDLSNARVFFSFIGKAEKKEVEAGLKNASGFIRKRLAETLNLRHTPSLTFIYDNSIENGAHIGELLKGLTYSHNFDSPEDKDNE